MRSLVMKIAEAIQINTTLKILDISHNNISRDIAVVLANCLKHNNTLEELIISWDDTNTTFICFCTTKCYVNNMRPYSVCHDHSQYFVHRYGSALPWSDLYLVSINDIYLMDTRFDELQLDD